MAAKKSKGRQKLEMVKMKNEINLQVTFSKRRFGLFKKASELVSLCGAEVALIVFSPGGKVYTFGHPTVQTIIHRYLGGGVGAGGGSGGGGVGPSNVAAGVDGHNNSADGDQRAMLAARLGNELNDKESQLEKEKKVGEIMGEKIKNSPLYKRWGKASVDEMDMSELLQFKAALEKLKMDIDAMKMKKSMQMLNEMMALDPPNPNLFFGGNDNFGDPYFGFNNLNPNDGYFLPTFDPFLALVPNQNPWEEESPEGATTFVGGTTISAGGATTLAGGVTTTLAGGATPLAEGVTALAGGGIALAGGTTPLVGGTTILAGGSTTILAEGVTPLAGGATNLVGGTTTLAGGATTSIGGATTSAGGATTLDGGATTFAGGTTTLGGGATTFASSSYPPPGFLY